MRLQFLGACKTVTGSKYLLEHNHRRYLIDCGLFQGLKDLKEINWQPLPVIESSIDALILTHAHIDHSGYIPILVRNGFKGPIYCTKATFDLCKILLIDSAKIHEEDAKEANKKGFSRHKPALPLYTEKDAFEALLQFVPMPYNEEIELDKNLSFSFIRNGHILGSARVRISSDLGTVVFSGDVGKDKDLFMKPPEPLLEADYLILESTYGNREHQKEDLLHRMQQIILSTLQRKGSIIIPAFAVGRAQTIIYLIYMLKKANMIPPYLPVYLDSPMAQSVQDLLCTYSEEHNLSHKICSQVTSTAEYTTTPDQSKKINQSHVPSIIISASGMAEGGRVLYHLKFYGPKPENTILLVGFQAKGTRGAQLVKKEKSLKIHCADIPIRAKVEIIDTLSSHADFKQLLNWLEGIQNKPKTIFLTHGEEETILEFKDKIEKRFGWEVKAPSYLESFELFPSKSTTSSSLV